MTTQGRVQCMRGVATTEYIIILLAIAVILISVTVNLGGTVKALWTGALDGDVNDLSSVASEAAEGVESMHDGPECPYVYNAGTGRWHDPANGHSFVSFEDASTSGCS